MIILVVGTFEPLLVRLMLRLRLRLRDIVVVLVVGTVEPLMWVQSRCSADAVQVQYRWTCWKWSAHCM